MPRKVVKAKVKVVKRVKAGRSTRQATHIRFILDSSGSMAAIRDATVAAYNRELAAIRDNAGKIPTTLGVTTFSGPTRIHIGAPTALAGAQPLTNFQPEGNTAMRDAIGRTVEDLQARVKDSKNVSYLVLVFTDGRDNASVTYSPERLSQLVTELQATERWTFGVIGANNIRLDDLAVQTGIPVANTLSYVPDAVGSAGAVAEAGMAVRSYLSAREVGLQASHNLFSPDTR